MRTQIVVIAFLGFAVSGCVESQSAYVPAVDPIEIEMSDESTSDTEMYFVESTNADGSREVRYQVEMLNFQQRSSVGNSGQRIVRSEWVPIVEEYVETVPYGEDIEEYLRALESVKIVPFETDPAVIAEVEHAPAPPAPSAD
jgi:hypothetical protein